MLGLLGSASERKYNVIYLESKGTAQDLLTVVPVPVPAAGLLLLGSLGAIGAMAKRRRRHA